jgi:hypothetical protein
MPCGMRTPHWPIAFSEYSFSRKDSQNLRIGALFQERLAAEVGRELCPLRGSKALLAAALSNPGSHYLLVSCNEGSLPIPTFGKAFKQLRSAPAHDAFDNMTDCFTSAFKILDMASQHATVDD